MTTVAQPVVSELTAAQGAALNRNRPVWWGVLVVGLCWIGALAGLVLWKSNPVTPNLRQLANADAVSLLRVDDLKTGQCTRVQLLLGEIPEHIVVRNLEHTQCVEGNEFIVPLMLVRQETYDVVSLPATTEFAPVEPLVYSGTAEARQVIQAALDSLRR